MEKQRIKPKPKFSKRLLTSIFLCLFFISNVFAQPITLSEINELRIKPVDIQNLYTKTDIKFEVSIPKTKSNQIQFISNNQNSDITFRTMRKSDDYKTKGTLLELWLNFDKEGTYRLNPIQLSINGRKRFISYEPITVSNDPSKQYPRIVIKFSNGFTIYSDNVDLTQPLFTAQEGQILSFTVFIQYTNQLINFTYDIPQDSILSQTKTYEIMEVRYREKKISHELIPIASFNWTCLANGQQILPRIKIIATSYSGSRHELIMPELPIFFSNDVTYSSLSENEHLFDSAFLDIPVINDNKMRINISREVCQKLADLYSKEKHSIFFHRIIKKERQNFELENNLPIPNGDEYSHKLLFGSLLIFLGALIILIISINEKKIYKIIFSVILIICSLISSIHGFIKQFETQGICTGCTIYSIPEENAEAKAEMGVGHKVKITEKTEKWFYIELGETGGWCKSENIIIIE